MKKIIKEQVKVQVKEQVSKILPRIEKSVNDQLEAEVLTRSSNKAKTSHAIAANLSELKPKKILIDKMENNKSIHRSVQQEALYKALVDAYKTNKDILDTYGDTVTFKRRQDDEDEDEEPSARSNWGSKRRRAGKEPESTSAPKDKTSMSSGKSKEGSKSHQNSTGKSVQAKEPIHADENLEEPAHQEFDIRFTEDQPVDETTQHPDWFQKPTKPPTPSRDWNRTLPAKHGPNNPEGQQFLHDLRKPLPLIPNSRGRRVIPFDHFINNDLAYLSGGVSSRTYATSVTKTKAADYGHIKWIEDFIPNSMWSKLTNLNIEERLALGVSLRMFRRSVVLRMRVKDLQLGVESYQKKLNLTRPDTYRSDLKRKTPYTAYSNPKGFIYQNKDKKNRLMHIDELHKFSDGTLTDVRSALNDILKRIWMEYLP
ncbi:hypothetical protein Tco_1045763 [Tanacetum coccineum]|uniref:Uncharacterized protein n=1 Tax=Tanacetum coccineum TaxID=301880 RepID=A0ABQ5GU06_9ASTR